MEGCVLRRIDLEGSEKVELSVFANCALCLLCRIDDRK